MWCRLLEIGCRPWSFFECPPLRRAFNVLSCCMQRSDRYDAIESAPLTKKLHADPPGRWPLQSSLMHAATRLAGGLFNQVWALQGLVMIAVESGAPLVLPLWDSHLWPASMGLERDVRFKQPASLPFAALWRTDIFVAAMTARGLTVLADAPADATKPIGSTAAMRRYTRYLEQRARAAEGVTLASSSSVISNASSSAAMITLEDAVYRSLQPAPHLARRIARLRRLVEEEARARRPDAAARYGCLHARVERDMQRWWYHVTKVRPPTLRQILRGLHTQPLITHTGAIYVCVGTDLKPRDREVLGQIGANQTAWGAVLLRRATLMPEAGETDAAHTSSVDLIPGSGVIRRKVGLHDMADWNIWFRSLRGGGSSDGSDSSEGSGGSSISISNGSSGGGGGSSGSSSSNGSLSLAQDPSALPSSPTPRSAPLPYMDPSRAVPLSYTEQCIIDLAICRGAEWSARVATLAYHIVVRPSA